MKKLKRMLSAAIVFCMVCCVVNLPVHAEYCCTAVIDSIIQSSDKLTVNFTTNSVSNNRAFMVGLNSVIRSDGYNMSLRIEEKQISVSSGEREGTVEFDSSLLIPGAEYDISLSYDVYCDNGGSNYHCQNSSESFFAEYGMPVYEVGNSFGNEFTINAGERFALKFTAAQKGIYRLSVESEKEWCLKYECNEALTDTAVFLSKDQTVYFQVSIWNGMTDTVKSCKAKFKVEPVNAQIQKPLTSAPQDGSVIYSMTDSAEIVKLEIPKTGQYEIYTKSEDNGEVIILNEDGERVAHAYFNEAKKSILNAGTYYCVTDLWYSHPETYTTTVKYVELPEIKFGDTISSDSYDDSYAKVKLDKMSAVWLNFTDNYLKVELDGKYVSSQRDYPTIFGAGEYLLSYYGSGSAVLCKEEIPTVTIGNNIVPFSANDNYVILKAPEDGEYEFCFPNGAWNGDDGSWISSGYMYMMMNKGDTICVKYDKDNEIIAKKYAPEYTSVNVGTENDLTFTQNKKSGFKFTADDNDWYILTMKNEYNGNVYFDKIKVYTQNEILYEGEGVYFEPLEIKLTKGEVVYADTLINSDSTVSVNVSKPRITEDTIVDCSKSLKETRIFVPESEGYYNFTAEKNGTSGYTYIGVKVNDKDLGSVSSSDGNSISCVRYISPDEPLKIVLTGDANQSSEIKLTFEKVQAKKITDISEFKIEDSSYYSFILPESGVYQITGSALFEGDYWREEGVYGYSFEPIIKNHEITSVSYDAQAGEIPIFFCGSKGDEVLFREVSDEYYRFNYPITASIKKVTTEEAKLENTVTSDSDFKLYHINVAKDGTYQFDDFSDELFSDNQYYGRGFTYFYADGEWNYMGSSSTTEVKKVFNLKSGVYYVLASVYDYNAEDNIKPKAKFKLSKVDTADKLEISGIKSATGLTYTVSGNIPENATLYAALYDGDKLKEIKMVQKPVSGSDVSFENSVGLYTCKLFLWDNNMTPLCDSTVCN